VTRLRNPSVIFYELPEFFVGVSPKSGSTSFARAYPDAVRVDPQRNAARLTTKPVIYYMRNPLSRLISAYKFFVTKGQDSKHCPKKEALGDFDRFVDYCMQNSNHHWNPVYPNLKLVSEVRHIRRMKELVGDVWENKPDPLAVFIRQETYAKIAAHWSNDFLVYQQIEQ